MCLLSKAQSRDKVESKNERAEMLLQVSGIALIIMFLLNISMCQAGDETSSQATMKKLQLIITGNTGGFSSWSNEIKGVQSLEEVLKQSREGIGHVMKEGFDVNFYKHGNRIIFKDPPWSVAEFRKFMASNPKIEKDLCDRKWVLMSASEISFEPDKTKCGMFASEALDQLAQAEGLPARTAMAMLKERGVGEVLKPVVEPKDLKSMKWSVCKLREVVADGGQKALMLEFPEENQLDWTLETNPEAWENRFVEKVSVNLNGTFHKLYTLARPSNDGSRRARLIEKIQEEEGNESIAWLDGGNLVEEIESSTPGKADKFRAISWEVAAKLKLRGLVPGLNELSAGVSILTQEAEKAGVPLISANLVKDGKALFSRYLVIQQGDLQMGIIGVTDSAIIQQIHPEKMEGAAIGNPIESIRSALEEMNRSYNEQLNLIVVIGNISGTWRQRLASELKGVDFILLADDQSAGVTGWSLSMDAPSHPDEEDTHPRKSRTRAPLLVHSINQEGLETLSGIFVDAYSFADLKEVYIIPSAIRETEPRDEEVALKIAQIRQQELDEGRELLLPDMDPIIKNNGLIMNRMLADPSFKNLSQKDLRNKKFPAVLTSELWTQLVVSILRRTLEADVALVTTLSLKYGGVGPVPRLFCEQNIPPNMLVLRIDMPGEAVRDIIYGQLAPAAILIAGTNDKGTMIDGRFITIDEWYRVAMTEEIWTLPAMQTLIAKYQISPDSAQRLFKKNTGDSKIYFPSEQGEKLFLRKVVIGELEELKQRYPDFGENYQLQIAKDLTSDFTDKAPRFYMDFKEFRLDVENWSEPTESYNFRWSEGNRISNSQFIRQNYLVNWGMTYDSQPFIWDLGTSIGFTSDHLGDRSQENYDAVIVSSGFAFPTLGTNLGRGFSIYPELRLTWQTELTVQEGLDPRTNLGWKRLNQLRGTLALSISGLGLNNLAYVGIFTQQNFPYNKHEEGVQLMFNHIKYFRKIAWQNQILSMYYLPNKMDNPYDVGFYAKWRTSLTVPFIKNLGFYTYIDILAYKGKVEATSKLGTSIIYGVGVSWSRFRWKPGRESLFH